ncbi:uncharacterized protein UHOD_20585 [Ustilago sp. UG-2017b]|nr:uncharacterized protein UHOD_20585 [Ustilago sp. UG-2017b]
MVEGGVLNELRRKASGLGLIDRLGGMEDLCVSLWRGWPLHLLDVIRGWRRNDQRAFSSIEGGIVVSVLTLQEAGAPQRHSKVVCRQKRDRKHLGFDHVRQFLDEKVKWAVCGEEGGCWIPRFLVLACAECF